MDTKNATACRVPFHDSMPSLMNFRRVLDLLGCKNPASQYFAGAQWCHGVWNSFSFLAWDLSMHPRTHIWFFNEFISLEHAHVVRIWVKHINALKTHLMHKNVQTNPEKTKKIHTTLLLFYVDTRKKIESNKRQRISLCPQKWDVPYRKPSCLLWEALVGEKHIPKPVPNGTKIYHGMLMPLHDSMPSFMNFRRVLDLL